MNNINKKYILIFVSILILNLAIFFNSNNLSCNKCIVEFKTVKQSGVNLESPMVYDIKVFDLYKGFLDNECLIKWDKNQGYYR